MTIANKAAIEESRMMIDYYAGKVHSLIAAKRQFEAIGRTNSAWHASTVGEWFQQWRRERRTLKALLAAQESDSHLFPSHSEMLAEFAAGMREHNGIAA